MKIRPFLVILSCKGSSFTIWFTISILFPWKQMTILKRPQGPHPLANAQLGHTVEYTDRKLNWDFNDIYWCIRVKIIYHLHKYNRKCLNNCYWFFSKFSVKISFNDFSLFGACVFSALKNNFDLFLLIYQWSINNVLKICEMYAKYIKCIRNT